MTASVVQARDLRRDYSFGNERVHALRGVTFEISSTRWAVSVSWPSSSGATQL